MSTFVKKVASVVLTSAVILTAVGSTAWVNAAYTNVEAAGILVDEDIIVDHTANPAAFELGNTLLKQEGVKVMEKLSGRSIPTSCTSSSFADVAVQDWVCKYIEDALVAGFIVANPNFGPEGMLTKGQALKMVMQARGIEKTAGMTPWQAGYVDAAVTAGIASDFSDYSTPVNRGTFFVWAAEAIAPSMDEEDEDDDLLSGLLDGLDETQQGVSSSSQSIAFTTWWGFWAEYVRTLISNWSIPGKEDIKHNNFLKDYSFKKPNRVCSESFCPIINAASVENPLTWKKENWLEFYLWSNIKEEDYTRKPTNFTIVLDVSGSMKSRAWTRFKSEDLFDDDKSKFCNAWSMYFNPLDICINSSEKQDYVSVYNLLRDKSKLEIAKETLISLIWKLQIDDRISIVTFSDTSTIHYPMTKLSDIDIKLFIEHVEKIHTIGWTNMESWLTKGIETFGDFAVENLWYQNRMVFITDARPNIWDTSEGWFKDLLKWAVEKNIYTSFMWVWLDFDQSLVESVSKLKWGNYFFIDSGYEFHKNFIQNFDYNFFPMFFNVKIDIEWKEDLITASYGIASTWTWEIINISTLFPSAPQIWWATKWSVILFKLKDNISNNISIQTSYEDWKWKAYSDKSLVYKTDFIWTKLFWANEEGFENIMKAILIVEYVDSLKHSIALHSSQVLDNIENKLIQYKDLFISDGENYSKDLELIITLKKLLNTNKDLWVD